MNFKKNRKLLIAALAFGGVLFATRILVAYFIIYFAGGFMTMSLFSIFVKIIIPFIIVLILINDLRKEDGGYWSFKQATKNVFILFLISILINFLSFDIIYTKIIDPNLKENAIETMSRAVGEYVQNGLFSDAQKQKMDEIQERIKSQSYDNFKDIVIGLGSSFIRICIGSLILGAIYQRRAFISPNRDIDDF